MKNFSKRVTENIAFYFYQVTSFVWLKRLVWFSCNLVSKQLLVRQLPVSIY